MGLNLKCFLLCLWLWFSGSTLASGVSNNLVVHSPDKRIELHLSINDGRLIYSTKFRGMEVIQPSNLGLKTREGFDLSTGFSLVDTKTGNKKEKVNLLYGEKPSFTVVYNFRNVSLVNSSGIHMNIELRVYNEGIAFRYSFSDPDKTLLFTDEVTEFNVDPAMTGFSEGAYESGYTRITAARAFSTLLPFTLISDNYALAINEAGNRNFSRGNLAGSGNGKIRIRYASANAQVSTPYDMPWRYVLIGDDGGSLIKNKHLMYALNEPHQLVDTDWIKPGKVFRAMRLNTVDVKSAIDFAASMNFGYVLLDAGWYGLGYGIPNESSPASDPRSVIDALNMGEVVAHANNKGIGIILYVNQVAWRTHNPEELVKLYASWGIKGLKLGFMRALSASDIANVYSIVEYAAEAQMVVNIHDNIRLTGLERYYPNLLTVEGIRGNEYVDNTGNHTTILPYTRFLTGAGDYTFCYPGYPEDFSPLGRLKTTKGHQLALATLFYSPLQHIFWYGIPDIYTNDLEVEYFRELPVVWDDFVVLDGVPGEYFSKARQIGDKWFVAAITNTSARTVRLPLQFLDGGQRYKVTFYQDDGLGGVIKQVWNPKEQEGDGFSVRRSARKADVLMFPLLENGGAVAILEPVQSFFERIFHWW